jgi:hypothetical protein
MFQPISFTKSREGTAMSLTKFSRRFVYTLLAFSPVLSKATVLYSNDFESGDPGTADFYDSTTGNQGVGITIVPNGGGTLGLTAPSGTHYAEITNTDDAYLPGYGQSVATDYGYQRNGGTFDGSGNPNGPGVASNAFYESTAYYINTAWAAAGPNNNYIGFWIDTTPHNDPGYLDETNFRITDTGDGTIGVLMVGLNGTGSTTITQSGWYTFKTTFQNNGGFVSNEMSVLDSSGNVVGSPLDQTSSLPFADLDGTNYGDWTTVWQDGFANDVLGIDNVQVGTLPEPASIGLIVMGASTLLVRRRRRLQA